MCGGGSAPAIRVKQRDLPPSSLFHLYCLLFAGRCIGLERPFHDFKMVVSAPTAVSTNDHLPSWLCVNAEGSIRRRSADESHHETRFRSRRFPLESLRIFCLADGAFSQVPAPNKSRRQIPQSTILRHLPIFISSVNGLNRTIRQIDDCDTSLFLCPHSLSPLIFPSEGHMSSRMRRSA